MSLSRARLLIASTSILFVLAIVPFGAVADSHIEWGMNREPMYQPLAFTNQDPTNETEGELEGYQNLVAMWLLSDSGSGTYTGNDCAGLLVDAAPATATTFVIVWGSEPLFDAPERLAAGPEDLVVRPVSDMNVTIQIEPAEGFAEPLAMGDVTFTMEVGWIRPPPRSSLHGPHGAWTGSTTVSPSNAGDLPIPAGILPSSVEVPVRFTEDDGQMEAGARLVFFLEVTCASDAAFNLSFGSIGDLEWSWGDPSEDSISPNNIPNSLDTHPDGTEWSAVTQLNYGTNPLDPNDHPGNPSGECEGYTIQEAMDEGWVRGDPSTCPGAGGIPLFLLLILALLLVVLLAGGAFGAVTTVNKKVRMTVSHDGFQDVKKGESARYELQLSAKGKEGEEMPVELSRKGVPEDWFAELSPDRVTLQAGEDVEPVTVTLTVTPPPEEEYEDEAVVTVTATPTDEDGKTSPLKPGTSVKTKTIVNIDVEPPEGEKRKKRKVKKEKEKEEAEGAEEDALAQEGEEGEKAKGRKKMLGALKFGRKKKKAEEEGETEAEAEGPDGDAEALESKEPKEKGDDGDGKGKGKGESAAAATAPTGKPDLAVGKLTHDPASFSEGDVVNTTVPVKNKGEQAVQGLMLRLYVNDDRVDEKELDLEPGEASEVTFTWTAQPDENRVRVRGGLKEA